MGSAHYLLPQGDLATATVMSNLPATEINTTSLIMTPFLGVINPLPDSRLIILTSSKNGRDVLLLLEYTYSGYELAFPACNASVKTISSVELQNAFSTVMHST